MVGSPGGYQRQQSEADCANAKRQVAKAHPRLKAG